MINRKNRVVLVVIKAVLLTAVVLCLAGCKSYFEISPMIDSGKCGPKLTWTLSDKGALTIKGAGNMDDYNENAEDFPWYAKKDKIVKIYINEGVSSIEANAFANCSNLIEVTIPNSVKTIDEDAFCGSKNLKDVHYTGTLKEWKTLTNGQPKIVLPKQIEKSSFDNNIKRSWLDKESRDYKIFMDYYELKDPFSYNLSSYQIEDMKEEYPATENYAIYVLKSGVTEREIQLLSEYLEQNTYYSMNMMLRDYELIEYIDELPDVNVELKKANMHLIEIAK